MTMTNKGPRPYHVATGRMAFPRNEDYARLGHALGERLLAKGFRLDISPSEWQTPEYPGGSALQLMLRKGDELGDVRVQWYGDDTKLRVASFLPGYETSSPGDTPKMNPERDLWCTSREEAGREYVQQIIAAFRNGWAVYDRERG